MCDDSRMELCRARVLRAVRNLVSGRRQAAVVRKPMSYRLVDDQLKWIAKLKAVRNPLALPVGRLDEWQISRWI